MEEREAIGRLKRGDIGGLEALVRRHQLQAVRAAYLVTRNRALAEDEVQAAFLKAFERAEQIDVRRPFAAWFHRVVVNAALKAVARRGRDVPLEPEGEEDAPLAGLIADPAPGPEALAELREAVREALAKLTPQQRAAVVLHYYLGLGEAEVAGRMGRAEGTVKWLLHEARKRLRGLVVAPLLLALGGEGGGWPGGRKGSAVVRDVLEEDARRAVPDDVDLWLVIRPKAQELAERRALDARNRARLYRRLALAGLPVAMVLLAVSLALLRPWQGRSLTPSAAVAQAYEALLSVKSVHVEEEVTTNRLAGVQRITRFDLPGLDWRGGWTVQGIQDRLRSTDCQTEPPSLQTCKLVDKSTGLEVGYSQFTGGRRVTQADYSLPGRAHWQTQLFPDHEIEMLSTSLEGLYADGQVYYMGEDGRWRPAGARTEGGASFFWGIFDQEFQGVTALGESFESVERLSDGRVDGVDALHYRAQKGGETVDLWTAKATGLPLKLDYAAEREGGVTWRSTVRFSRYDEPLDIPAAP